MRLDKDFPYGNITQASGYSQIRKNAPEHTVVGSGALPSGSHPRDKGQNRATEKR